MKDINLLVWLTQLGFSVVFPLAGFTLLAVLLRVQFGLGIWVLFGGGGVGLLCAIDGFRQSIKAMERMGKHRDDNDPPPVSFNDHH